MQPRPDQGIDRRRVRRCACDVVPGRAELSDHRARCEAIQHDRPGRTARGLDRIDDSDRIVVQRRDLDHRDVGTHRRQRAAGLVHADAAADDRQRAIGKRLLESPGRDQRTDQHHADRRLRRVAAVRHGRKRSAVRLHRDQDVGRQFRERADRVPSVHQLLDHRQPLDVRCAIEPLSAGAQARADDTVAAFPDTERLHRNAGQARSDAAPVGGAGGGADRFGRLGWVRSIRVCRRVHEEFRFIDGGSIAQ